MRLSPANAAAALFQYLRAELRGSDVFSVGFGRDAKGTILYIYSRRGTKAAFPDLYAGYRVQVRKLVLPSGDG